MNDTGKPNQADKGYVLDRAPQHKWATERHMEIWQRLPKGRGGSFARPEYGLLLNNTFVPLTQLYPDEFKK